MMAETTIRLAQSEADYRAFLELIGEYTDWCRSRYAADGWFVEAAFGHQSLGAELEMLPAIYGPPNGRTLLATSGEAICGACAFRRLSEDACEMKRLFVPVHFQGQGLGRRLAQAAMAAARGEGYKIMRLDTANRMAEAIALYRALGFRPCPPYHLYPEPLMPYMLFMESALDGTAGSDG